MRQWKRAAWGKRLWVLFAPLCLTGPWGCFMRAEDLELKEEPQPAAGTDCPAGDRPSCDEERRELSCGDGVQNADEACDDGNSDNTDECTESCAPPTCGDGFKNGGEECDDANQDDADGCGRNCTFGVVDVVAGASHTCALRGDGALKCWGDNSWGQLGQGDTSPRGDGVDQMGALLPPISLGTGRKVTALGAGHEHTCALLDDGAVKCWGDNTYGRLGIGDDEDRGDEPSEMGDELPAVLLGTGRTAIGLGVGLRHTCALLDDGSVKCWGRNLTGEVGLGGFESGGRRAGDMGDNLPAIPLGAGRTAKALSVRFTHSCALLDDGSVKCWGDNEFGQLGLEDTNNRGDDPDELGDYLPAVSLGKGRTIRALGLGYLHSCALLDGGSVKCWGGNMYGQLGLGDTNHRGDEPNEMGDNLPAVSLGTGRTARALYTGAHSTCALLDDGFVKCWGNNQFGGLGLGDVTYRGDEPDEMGDSLPAVSLGSGRTSRRLSGGGGHTCALLDDSSVKCWGLNGRGQLGQGDAVDRGDGFHEMGDSLPPVSLW